MHYLFAFVSPNFFSMKYSKRTSFIIATDYSLHHLYKQHISWNFYAFTHLGLSQETEMYRIIT